ncbi:stalk domain-containing protein [Paenibacillus naphthalenovorans]|uniref:stalk domain-containing protein n=1 Tax=Paenibacillus naphthalenovorans TaxID=162209 RepID=UPI00087E91F3|nr:stalk domain-containing protein [Paenibacillus naphthalenovorans]SDJ09418.1 Copper amine oxidase N-terminal domain-containing protein [Paenibacillus naphthalenovorans]
MSLQKKWRKLSCVVLAASLLLSSWPGTGGNAAYAANEPTVTMLSQEILTSGAVLKKYVWKSMRNNKEVQVNGNVIEVDLTNPNVKLDVMTGTGNQFTKKQTVLGMTKETKAVAGINGDFYNTQAEGVPMGPQISNGQLMATPPYLPGFYSFALDKNNKPIVDLFTFKGSIIAKDGASYPLGGINKTYYWFEPSKEHSHIDGMFMYTNAWGQIDRSNDGVTVPTEVLVQNGIIKQIAVNGIIRMIAPEDGYILRASGKAADFVVTHLKEGDPLKADYQVLAQDPNKNYDVSTFKMMIGGHTIMVDEGKPAAFSREVASLCCNRSRTAIGYSQDMKTAYLITVDNYGDSKGLSMQELQQFMIKVGVWKGLNLDGGGSTQMAARPLGEFEPVLVNKTETGAQRRVVNGVGVYSTAPQGEVKEIFIQAPSFMFVGEQAALGYKAYDIYYNPVETSKLPAQWSVADNSGTFKENVFTATKPGVAKVTAVNGKGQSTANIEVVGRNQLKSMSIKADNMTLTEGESVKLPPVIATTLTGKSREIPPQLIQWEVLGIQGELANGTLKVNSLAGSTGAQLIAKYDGYSTMTVIPAGVDKVWYDLDNFAVMTTSEVKPQEVKAGVSIKLSETGNKYLELNYDFTQGTGNKWAYAAMNTGIVIEGQPQYMKVKVNGDESLNWLRAEILDNAGKVHLVDLARSINWKGWKQVTADLSEYPISYPIRVKSIYVVNEEIGQDERLAKSAIGIDDITFTYRGGLAKPSFNSISLTINKKDVTVNGKKMMLEQAPVIEKGNTLIPIRFVTDALGGTVRWDDTERKVTVIRGGKMIDLWIDNPDLIVNGQRVTAEVPPVIMNNLTMVPLRILSENLGWKVTWDPQTRQVTLQ